MINGTSRNQELDGNQEPLMEPGTLPGTRNLPGTLSTRNYYKKDGF
jgi:hypothetical protein